ncbi:hypothetical protein [Microbacterium paraoxydans]|uniref:phosphatase domain-containing protein n=1 Tax=Microbacterium paraoxydans TaxID=199592 RepID=UPI003EBACF0F
MPFDRLLLRRTGDQRAGNVVKAEMYDAPMKPYFTVIGVLDHQSVLEPTCLQVAEGDF